MSFPELERLALQYQQCLEEAGAQVSPESGLIAGPSYYFVFGAEKEVQDSAVRCVNEYWEPLGPAWGSAHPIPRETLAEADGSLIECLSSSGLQFDEAVPDDIEIREMRNPTSPTFSTFRACADKVRSTYRLPEVWAGGGGSR